jgi:hypothetical protein
MAKIIELTWDADGSMSRAVKACDASNKLAIRSPQRRIQLIRLLEVSISVLLFVVFL